MALPVVPNLNYLIKVSDDHYLVYLYLALYLHSG